MKRLFAAIRNDFRLQWRYGLYYAAAFVSVVWIALLSRIPSRSLALALPFIIFTDLAVIGFYFIAGMIMFEKGEDTLSALVVTPLSFWEYLASKLITLTLLAMAVTFVVVVPASRGQGISPAPLAAGVVLTSLIILLVGFIAAARYDSISSFLLPSQLYLLPLSLPVLHYFGYWQSPVLYLIPTQGSLFLLRGAFTPLESWQVVYSLVYQVVWLIVLARLAHWSYNRYIIAGRGVH